MLSRHKSLLCNSMKPDNVTTRQQRKRMSEESLALSAQGANAIETNNNDNLRRKSKRLLKESQCCETDDKCCETQATKRIIVCEWGNKCWRRWPGARPGQDPNTQALPKEGTKENMSLCPARPQLHTGASKNAQKIACAGLDLVCAGLIRVGARCVQSASFLTASSSRNFHNFESKSKFMTDTSDRSNSGYVCCRAP